MAKKGDKLPALMFYVRDWISDDDLQACSLAARGMWIDMICLMHLSGIRGKLVFSNGKPWTDKQIVDRVTCPDTEEARYAALAELRERGVARTDADGATYNSRMVRDEHIRQVRSEAGSHGGKQNVSKTQANRQAKSKQNASKPSSKTQANFKQTLVIENANEDGDEARADEEKRGGAQPDDPTLLVGPDTTNLLHDWLGHAKVSSHMMFSVGGLIRDYGQHAVDEGIRISIENNVHTFKYLAAVVANGSKRSPKSESGEGWEVPF